MTLQNRSRAVGRLPELLVNYFRISAADRTGSTSADVLEGHMVSFYEPEDSFWSAEENLN